MPVKPVKNSVHMEPKESNSKPGIPQLTAGTPGSHCSQQPSGDASQGVEPKKDKTHRRQSKMSSSKKIDLSRDFAAAIYLCEAPSPPRFVFGVVEKFCRF